MKPRIGVYLSKRTAARLTNVSRHRGATKSALVEAALDRFLETDDTSEAVVVTDRLASLSGQIEQLDRDLGIVSEIVALHARFHLAVTPELPAAIQDSACRLGSARFDEFAAQVERRLQHRTPLMQETMDRLSATRLSVAASDPEEGEPPGSASTFFASGLGGPNHLDDMPEYPAAVREDGSISHFPAQSGTASH